MSEIYFNLPAGQNLMIRDQSPNHPGHNRLDDQDQILINGRSLDPSDTNDILGQQAMTYLKSVLGVSSFQEVTSLRGARVIYQLRRSAYEQASRGHCNNAEQLLLTSNSLARGLSMPTISSRRFPLIGLFSFTQSSGEAIHSMPSPRAQSCSEAFSFEYSLQALLPLDPSVLDLD